MFKKAFRKLTQPKPSEKPVKSKEKEPQKLLTAEGWRRLMMKKSK